MAETDLISRADIEWHDYLVADGNGMYHNEQVAYRSQIDAIPSAQTDISDYCDRLWKIAYERGKKEALSCSEKPNRSDIISRQAAIVALSDGALVNYQAAGHNNGLVKAIDVIKGLPSAQPTLYGYPIQQLELIARVLQKEDLPPERIVEALTDIGRIVAIVKEEFEEILRKAVEQCTMQGGLMSAT